MSVGVASPSPARGQGNVASKYRRQRDRERTYERLVERENEDDGGEDFDDGGDFRGGGSKDEGNGDVKARRRRGRSGAVDVGGDEDGDNDKHDDDEKDDRIARLMEQVERLTEKVEDLVGVVAGQMEREGLDEQDEGEQEERDRWRGKVLMSKTRVSRRSGTKE